MDALPAFTTLGAGPTVLMLHDVLGGHLTFAPQVESLAAAGYRAVAWDMPGYGRSAPIDPCSFKGLAQSCIDLIEALKAGSVVLVGLSDLEAPLPLQRAVLQEIRIQGSYVFTQAEFARATALLAHLPDALAVRRPFAMAQASFEELLAGRLAEAKVVLLHGGYDA